MSHRPTVYGTRHAVSAGHYLAAAAAFSVLEAGGNAIDAGCAAGIALGVLQPDLVNVAGVAPIMIRLANGRVESIAGLGWWPKRLPADIAPHPPINPPGDQRNYDEGHDLRGSHKSEGIRPSLRRPRFAPASHGWTGVCPVSGTAQPAYQATPAHSLEVYSVSAIAEVEAVTDYRVSP